ncbi:MAG: sodium:calcium antiporter [Actinobacteria bacterium]|nr:sodium:calcium antiporter [Actinomycetota bacterium]MCL5445900.1 sodium:calcium antiporter [Actinomycetota bacterium]
MRPAGLWGSHGEDVTSTALLFIVSVVAIVVGAELFTNAVEWAGFLLELGTGATGSLLAALGTSLPETIVPIVAIAAARPHSTAIATGAVLGSSFMLLGLGVAITGMAVILRRSQPVLSVPKSQSRLDLGVFLVAFSGSLVIMPFDHVIHVIWGFCLIVVYAVYVGVTLKKSTSTGDMPEPLHVTFHRSEKPHWSLVTLQLLLSVACLVAGSDIFVAQIGIVATKLHVNPLVLALVVIPLATEFPETLNSVLWVRSGSDGLAFGNVAGSAAFQSCVLGFVAVVFTPWHLPDTAVVSGVLTVVTAGYLLFGLWNGHSRGRYLTMAVLPWVVFVVFEMVAVVSAPAR